MDIILIPLLEVVVMVIGVYTWIIIAQAVLSWLLAFNVVNPHNRFFGQLSYALYRLTEPALSPIRNFLPNLGTIDISPVILLMILWFLEGVIHRFAMQLQFS